MILGLVPIFWIVYDEKKFPKFSWRHWLSVYSPAYLGVLGLKIVALALLLGMAVLHAFYWLGLLILLALFSLAFYAYCGNFLRGG